MAVIDADTHVIESEATWEHFDISRDPRRPYLVHTADDQAGRRRSRWVIDGNLVPRPAGRGSVGLATPPIEGDSGDADTVLWSWRSFEDPIGRVDDAKARDIDRQIVYPTLFISHLTDDPRLELELVKAYNRFMAAAWQVAEHRFRWVVVPALRDLDASIEELRYGKDHGAVGVLFHGIEGDRSLGDPYFDPIYATAQELDLPVCIHTGAGCAALNEISDNRYMRNFGHVRVLPLIGFHDLIFSRVPERFPTLRFGTIEACASWAPYLLHFLRRSSKRSGRDASFFGPTLFEDYRMYIACEADEDIPYLAEKIGSDHLLIGSDYGHTDQSAELDIVDKLRVRGDLSEGDRRLLLETNPSAFYGL